VANLEKVHHVPTTEKVNDRFWNLIPETPESVSENVIENEEFIPPDVFKRTESVANNLLPAKSQGKYEAAYAKFMQWRDKKKK